MLLSKRAEMFLPEQWPAYFGKAEGCHVWDMDGIEYVDMSIMGIPKYYEVLLGREVNQDLKKGTAMKWEMLG